ncbi:MAG: cytochrome c oxidase assembly protein [Rhizobiales bacterium]|nr:cytochrome c oxidase assembly protein [Hyphomicrobiales bacterium]
MTQPIEKQNTPRNGLLAGVCVAVVAGMIGLSYAAVPLYQLFCQVTGFGGTTQRAEAPDGNVGKRQFTVRFDSNVNPALKWHFKPTQRSVEVKSGQQALAFYEARNDSNGIATGTATFNVTPQDAGAYFSKVECFCFTEQTLKSNESVSMPVSFFIDPDIENDENLNSITTITLSYTFFPVKPEKTVKLDGGESEPKTVN